MTGTACDPAAAPVPARPWPVVLLTALGAWLSALPLLLFFGALFGAALRSEATGYVLGALLVGGAGVVLRARAVALFVEQLAVPPLLTGLALLGWRLGRDLGSAAGLAVTAVLVAALALPLARAWLRALLGAGAAGVTGASVFALVNGRHAFGGAAGAAACTAVLVLALLQAAALARAQRQGQAGAAALRPFTMGWVGALLAMLAAWSGMSMAAGGVLGGSLGGDLAAWTLRRRAWADPHWQAASALAALGAAAWTLRTAAPPRGLAAVASVVAAVLAWFMPALGAALLVLAGARAAGERAVAAAALLAVLWIVGSFYYALQMPLAHKAFVLAGLGAALLAASWRPRGLRAPLPRDARTLALLATPAAALLLANVGIVRHEATIARGRPVFVELVPVDPRSLVQGDYMRLRFRLPREVEQAPVRPGRRARAVVRVDAAGVGSVLRADDGQALGADELAVELTPKAGRWTFVTDAWFFREGDGARWQAARYGEFRIDPAGRALLVGLADAERRAIRP